MKLLITNLTVLNALPSVIWHGMGDTANSAGMRRMKQLIIDHTDNDYVLSLQIGDTTQEDRRNGFLMPVFDQIQIACEQIRNDPNLQGGYHALGFSQGSQFLRGVAQVCPEPPMVNLVSIDGQHQGVFGFPGCLPEAAEFCDLLRDLLVLAYVPAIQEILVQAQYWHDPVQDDLHKRSSLFIGPINNEVRDGVPHNDSYKANLLKLEHFVMCMGLNDVTVIPKETAHFGFHPNGHPDEVVPFQELDVYTKHQLPLKEMEENGQLKFYTHTGGHLNFSNEWFIETCIPYLQ